MPPSCALLGGFAIGARVALLWQHNANAKCQRVPACTRSMPSCVCVLSQLVGVQRPFSAQIWLCQRRVCVLRLTLFSTMLTQKNVQKDAAIQCRVGRRNLSQSIRYTCGSLTETMTVEIWICTAVYQPYICAGETDKSSASAAPTRRVNHAICFKRMICSGSPDAALLQPRRSGV